MLLLPIKKVTICSTIFSTELSDFLNKHCPQIDAALE